MKSIKEMDRSITCLALQLPESVWDDINKKWQEVKKDILIKKDERLQKIIEKIDNKDDPMWSEKAEVFDFYHEHFEYILGKLLRYENKSSTARLVDD
jgi:hypothetical protein